MKATVFREGDRIRASGGQGYHDLVSDHSIRGHLGGPGPRAASDDAFALAVLAIRAYERAARVDAARLPDEGGRS